MSGIVKHSDLQFYFSKTISPKYTCWYAARLPVEEAEGDQTWFGVLSYVDMSVSCVSTGRKEPDKAHLRTMSCLLEDSEIAVLVIICKPSPPYVASYLGLIYGLHFSYPAKEFSPTYLNVIRPWFQRAISCPGLFTISTAHLHATANESTISEVQLTISLGRLIQWA